MIHLRKGERCPVHGRYDCCGRMPEGEKRFVGSYRPKPPVQRIDDPHHPRGYREVRSKGEMRKLLNRKIERQNNLCGICGEPFTDYRWIVPDHIVIQPAGCKKDDHPDNIQAAHSSCNMEKGSRRP